MAGRDRALKDPPRTLVTLPEELRWVIKRYQNDRKLPTFSSAIRELIETHPEICIRVANLYDWMSREQATGG